MTFFASLFELRTVATLISTYCFTIIQMQTFDPPWKLEPILGLTQGSVRNALLSTQNNLITINITMIHMWNIQMLITIEPFFGLIKCVATRKKQGFLRIYQSGVKKKVFTAHANKFKLKNIYRCKLRDIKTSFRCWKDYQ